MSKKSQPTSGKDSQQNFEERLQRLEEIVQTLEDGGSSLDDALALYEEGIAIAGACSKELERAQLRLKQLSKNAEGALELTDIEEE